MTLYIPYHTNKDKFLTKYLYRDTIIEPFNEALNSEKNNIILYKIFDYPAPYIFYPIIFHSIYMNLDYIHDENGIHRITKFTKDSNENYYIYINNSGNDNKNEPIIEIIKNNNHCIISYMNKYRYMELPEGKTREFMTFIKKCYSKFNNVKIVIK